MPRLPLNLAQHSSGIRVRLFLLVLLAVLPALSLIIYSGLKQREQDATRAGQNAQEFTQQAAARYAQTSEETRQLLVLISKVSYLRESEQCDALLKSLRLDLPQYRSIGVASTNGEVFCSSIPLSQPLNVADRSYFQEAIAQQRFSQIYFQISRVSGQASLAYGYPWNDQSGAALGAVIAAIDLPALWDSLSGSGLPEGSRITLFDKEGIVLARNLDADQWIGKPLEDSTIFAAMRGGAGGTFEAADLDGVQQLYAFTRIGAGESAGYLNVSFPKRLVYAEANQNLRSNLGLLAVVTLLALLAAWLFGDLFLIRRTRALVAATEKLRAGDLTGRTGQSHDASELGQLARSFDAMADAVQARETERDRAQKELAGRNEELEAFTYSVSHDLKEPLRTLRTYSQFLIQDYDAVVDDEGKEMLQGIGDASVRMARLVDEVLALSRLSREAPAARVDLNPLLQEIVHSLGGAIEAKGAVVNVEPLPDVFAPSARVEQIFANLLSNALKFNESSPPEVTIGTESTSDGMVTFFVRDNGVGIEPEYHEVIFGLFKRLHHREDFEGTGAGLAIVKRAIEASGGKIWVESALGAGTTFRFTLPAWQPAASLEAA
jgi:signal transduction histidine kinase